MLVSLLRHCLSLSQAALSSTTCKPTQCDGSGEQAASEMFHLVLRQQQIVILRLAFCSHMHHNATAMLKVLHAALKQDHIIVKVEQEVRCTTGRR